VNADERKKTLLPHSKPFRQDLITRRSNVYSAVLQQVVSTTINVESW